MIEILPKSTGGSQRVFEVDGSTIRTDRTGRSRKTIQRFAMPEKTSLPKARRSLARKTDLSNLR